MSKRTAKSAQVYIPVEGNFLDFNDQEWKKEPGGTALDLGEIIIHTIRVAPVKTFEDAERGLAIIQAIKERAGAILITKSDYEWMMNQMRATAYKVWLPPDAAFLVHYIETVHTSKESSEPE